MNEISRKSNIWMWVSAAFLCTSILGGYFAIDYMGKFNSLQAEYEVLMQKLVSVQRSLDDNTVVIDLVIDYGNDTIVWYNASRFPLNTNLLNATKQLVEVEQLGNFVTKINNVGDDGSGYFWLWYKYKDGWDLIITVAAHQYKLMDGDILKWVYTDTFPF